MLNKYSSVESSEYNYQLLHINPFVPMVLLICPKFAEQNQWNKFIDHNMVISYFISLPKSNVRDMMLKMNPSLWIILIMYS